MQFCIAKNYIENVPLYGNRKSLRVTVVIRVTIIKAAEDAETVCFHRMVGTPAS